MEKSRKKVRLGGPGVRGEVGQGRGDAVAAGGCTPGKSILPLQRKKFMKL